MLRHPDDVALNSQLETAILQMREQSRPANTAKAIDPKIEEYFQFCDELYPQDQYRYSLDYEKVYRFMWYQVFREQKPRGGNKSQLKDGVRFDKVAYLTLMDKFKDAFNAGTEVWPVPEKPTGKSVFTAYKNVFRVIHKAQTAAAAVCFVVVLVVAGGTSSFFSRLIFFSSIDVNRNVLVDCVSLLIATTALTLPAGRLYTPVRPLYLPLMMLIGAPLSIFFVNVWKNRLLKTRGRALFC